MPEKSTDPDIRYCVKCGAGSHREDWKKLKPEEIFCDGCKPVAPVKPVLQPAKPTPPLAPTQPPKVPIPIK